MTDQDRQTQTSARDAEERSAATGRTVSTGGTPEAAAPPPMKWIFVVMALVAVAVWLAR
jgi:hypothetical protein